MTRKSGPNTEEIYTVEKLKEAVENKALNNVKFDAIYIMQGTNDIRHGGDGIKVAKKLANTVQELMKDHKTTKIAAVEIPPLQDSKLATERFLFNKTINNQDIPIVKTKEAIGELKIRETLNSDGVHITEKAGEIVAHQIKLDINNIEIKARTPERTVEEQTHSKTIEVPSGSAKFIIGVQGNNIKKLNRKIT